MTTPATPAPLPASVLERVARPAALVIADAINRAVRARSDAPRRALTGLLRAARHVPDELDDAPTYDALRTTLAALDTHVAMEPPVRYDARHLCNEKVKVLQAIRAPAVEDVATMSAPSARRAWSVGGRWAATSRG